MVPEITTTYFGSELHSSQSRGYSVPPEKKQDSSIDINANGSFQNIGEFLTSAGLSKDAANIIMASWRHTTKQQYGTYYKKWVCFCREKSINQINPSLHDIISFLTKLHQSGLGYSTINTAKSMLSSIFEILFKQDIGNNPLIKRFMRGIFQLKPALPRYNVTWNVNKVLEFLKDLPTDGSITLRLLSMKLAVLLALTTGQRCQTLSLIDINSIELHTDHLKIRIANVLKQTKPNKHLPEICIERYPDVQICVVNTLKEYLRKTQAIRKSSTLFVITQKPHSPASKSTISSWIKLVLHLSGIDTSIFKPHSTRSASASEAIKNVSVDTVIRTAGWTKENTFRKFYKRPVTIDSSYSNAVLSSLN